MTDLQTGESTMAGGGALEFRRPGVRQALPCLLAVAVFLGGFALLPGIRVNVHELVVPYGFFALLVPVFLLLSIQRVVVDGTSVRVMNMSTRFRWRSFDASEVTQLRVRSAGMGQIAHGFLVSLAPAAHRTWNEVALSSAHQVKYHEGIDVPFFVALTQAVTRVQRAMLVQGLPMYYDGVLPGPRRTHLTEFEEERERQRQARAQANADEPRKTKRRKSKR